VKPDRTLISLIAFVTIGTAARAQPTSAQAEVLFRQGKELMAAGQYAEACTAFDAAQKLDPTAPTMLNRASCREKNGQIATAWGLFVEAEHQTRAATDERTKQMHRIAAEHASDLEVRLSTLAINVPADAKIGGLEVLRDQDVLDPGAWNRTLPIDGGTYKITARAPGNLEWTTTITIAGERDARTVDIPRLKAADLRRQPAAPPARPAPPSEEAGAVDASAAPPRRRWVPFAIGGGALALLGGAIALELVAESTHDRARTDLDPDRQRSLWHTANTQRYAAEALAAAGAAAAGAAVWLYLRDRPSERAVAVAPLASGDRIGVQIAGGF
jgi:tetratricopeptide repeat protein